MKRIVALSAFAILALSIGTARAQPEDYRTLFTFSAPVTLPGVTLPAGTYLFRLADPTTGRKVINVLSADGKRSLAMLHTIPNQLITAPQNAEIRFMEVSANTPLPIKTWWYPGKAIGYEFIYPRAQALELAKVASDPVLTTIAETPDLENVELARISRSGDPTPVVVTENPAPVVAAGRAQLGDIAPPATNAVSQEARADLIAPAPGRSELPQTASMTPTVVLFGTAAVIAGVLLMLWRRPQF
jgi:LPXTG-motif cell wall-anchored protein